MPKKVYVLHKNGAKSHYIGLEKLLEDHQVELLHREFSIVGKFFKALFKWQPRQLRKQFTNVVFFVRLLFKKDIPIVLGIAPYDKKLKWLLPFLSNHQIFYHTSWTCWDKSFHPKTKGNSPVIFKTWKSFLENKTNHIFCVTQTSKEALCANYNLPNKKISVVYHALNHKFTANVTTANPQPRSFIYYGRLVKSKGITELLETFSKYPKANLTIMGQGPLQEKIIEFSERFKNIKYITKTDNREQLLNVLKAHQFVILNSKTTRKWEELFGLIIIEGMSQGLIPIAPKHSGPKEIITPDAGFLFEEGRLETCLHRILTSAIDTQSLSKNAINHAQKYRANLIAKRWSPILTAL